MVLDMYKDNVTAKASSQLESLRFWFRFSKIYFYRIGSGSGAMLYKNCGSSAVRVRQYQISEALARFKFKS